MLYCTSSQVSSQLNSDRLADVRPIFRRMTSSGEMGAGRRANKPLFLYFIRPFISLQRVTQIKVDVETSGREAVDRRWLKKLQRRTVELVAVKLTGLRAWEQSRGEHSGRLRLRSEG